METSLLDLPAVLSPIDPWWIARPFMVKLRKTENIKLVDYRRGFLSVPLYQVDRTSLKTPLKVCCVRRSTQLVWGTISER